MSCIHPAQHPSCPASNINHVLAFLQSCPASIMPTRNPVLHHSCPALSGPVSLFDFLCLQCPAFFLACIHPGLHSFCPASIMPCVRRNLLLLCPILSCIFHVLYLYCPEPKLSFIDPIMSCINLVLCQPCLASILSCVFPILVLQPSCPTCIMSCKYPAFCQ